MECLLRCMQDQETGVTVRNVKIFMNKIPSVFTGSDVINWMSRNLDCDDANDALHLAHLLATHGYIFPIDDHVLTVKNDNTFYRFQTPCLWTSACMEPDETDYAVYLCKRTMQNKQRLELANFEAENLAKLQKSLARKWELIYLQAEAQAKVDKKRDKLDRQILDSQERAFWDVHRPAPGCVNATEVDIKKTCRTLKQVKTFNKVRSSFFISWLSLSLSLSSLSLSLPLPHKHYVFRHYVEHLRRLLDRRRIKISKSAESYMSYYELYKEFDAFVTSLDPSNPWLSDSTELWEQETTLKEIPHRQVNRWSFSIHELLKDSAGREHFMQFLEKEFSAENLKFWEACQQVKKVPLSLVEETVRGIYNEFLAPGAIDPVNVDSHVADIVKQRIEQKIDRYCLDVAEEHIYKLMKNDSYNRYARSDMYKELMTRAKKKVCGDE
ncbi:hypothetical protein HELRODRAFT_105287 [Helobdella robusta]|uniref:Uncharacterized protein n=1 Tax=Helobdella robusta TaxID=6412 RepID=T1EDT1_HELRO|nr:hypothetical protein HELRODRAFT_105287 [Helobdella robusta]ESO12348.1 hypothetical protein HELRODRAFT_105287 [Helobdella robusta]